MGETKTVVLSKSDGAQVIGRATIKAVIALLLTVLLSAVQMIRHGLVSDYLLLLIGAIASIGAVVGYVQLLEKKDRGFLPMILNFGAFIPYFFGCYLVFYRGFWRLGDLSSGFFFSVIFKAGCFVLLGYAVVSGIYKLTKLVRLVNEQRLRFE